MLNYEIGRKLVLLMSTSPEEGLGGMHSVPMCHVSKLKRTLPLRNAARRAIASQRRAVRTQSFTRSSVR